MAGAPTKDNSLHRRVSQLEREAASLRRDLERQTNRLFHHDWPRDVRLAQTVDGGETYPTSGNTFYIELLDSWFPAIPGDQTPTHEKRGERLVGHVLSGDYLAEGTVCFALYSRGLGAAGAGEWWIWSATGAFYIGKVVVADIAAGSWGTVERHNQAWVATGNMFSVLNAHDVTLKVGKKVRWGKYPGWTAWVCEPWQFRYC
jgi:hypothetical protein